MGNAKQRSDRVGETMEETYDHYFYFVFPHSYKIPSPSLSAKWTTPYKLTENLVIVDTVMLSVAQYRIKG